MQRTVRKPCILYTPVILFLLGAVLFDPASPSRSFAEEDAQRKGADPVQREGQDDLLLARILKQLGEKEEGHFILVLKRSAVRSITPTTRIPPNARRSGNKWREVVYQVELLEGRQTAAEFLLAYAAFTQKPNREKASYDWKLVRRVEDPTAARQEFEKTKTSANQKSVTARPRTATGMTFFFKDGAPKPFQRRPNKP